MPYIRVVRVVRSVFVLGAYSLVPRLDLPPRNYSHGTYAPLCPFIPDLLWDLNGMLTRSEHSQRTNLQSSSVYSFFFEMPALVICSESTGGFIVNQI